MATPVRPVGATLKATLTKSGIDRLGERLRVGPLNRPDLLTLDQYRRSVYPPYAEVIERLRQLGFEVSGRPSKSRPSIVSKLKRESVRLSQVQDIAGCRVVVDRTAEHTAAIALLTSAFPYTQIHDRRGKPSFGYRAVHLVALVGGVPVELVSIHEFLDADQSAAEDQRLEAEIESLEKGLDLEIVVLESASRATLERTHQRYFSSLKTLGSA